MHLVQDYSQYIYPIICPPRAYRRHTHGKDIDVLTMYIVLLGACSFNRVDLPPYETMDKLKEKLTCAIEETAGFHVE